MKKLFINTKEDVEVEALLLQIFNTLYSYFRTKNEYPEAVQMTSSNYLLIQEKRPDVIIKEENDYYILGMKVCIFG